MTTIATATFPGASGAAWPSSWTITGSTATQLGSGAARLSPPAAAYNNGAIRALFNGTGGMPATSDQEVRGTFRLPVTGEQYHDIGVGATTATQVTNGTIVPTTGFFVSIYTSGVSLFRAYDLHEDALSTTITPGTTYNYAFRRVAADKVAWKHWTGTEPSAWTLTATVSGSTDTTSGYVFLSAGNGSGTTVRPFDQMGPITITDGATGTAYTDSLSLTVSGTLTNTSTRAGTGALALTGTGTLVAAAVAQALAALGISGAGNLVPAATAASAAALGLTGIGALSGTATAAGTSPLALVGSGTLATTSSRAATTALGLTGDGGLASGATVAGTASSGLTGAGMVGMTTTTQGNVTAPLDGSGTLTMTSSVHATASVDLGSAGTLTESSSRAGSATLPLTGSGTLAGTAWARGVTPLELTGAGLLIIDTGGANEVPLVLSGDMILDLASTAHDVAPVALAGSVTLDLTAAAHGASTLPLIGAGTLAPSAAAVLVEELDLDGELVLVLATLDPITTVHDFAGRIADPRYAATIVIAPRYSADVAPPRFRGDIP